MNPDTAVISIGQHNRYGNELSPLDWDTFKFKVRTAAFKYGSPVFEGEGYGVWKGTLETSYTLILTNLLPLQLATFFDTLRTLATLYRQEAIALTRGTVDFVPAYD